MRKKLVFFVSLALILIIGCLSWYGYRINRTAHIIYQPLEDKNTVSVQKNKPVSVLLLGVDQRPGDPGRSDTMMLLTLNPNNDRMSLLSIPRDTRTEIIGKNKVDKINHAYAYGGAQMSVDTVSHLLNVPVDFYVQTNLEGFMSIVDIFGGISVNVSQDFHYEDVFLPKGSVEMSGKSALAYSRMRYDDPKGDIGRTDRQKQIITALIEKGQSFQTFAELNQILDLIKRDVRTNFQLRDLMNLYRMYPHSGKLQVEQMQLDGQSRMINGVSYYELDEKQLMAVRDELQKQVTS